MGISSLYPTIRPTLNLDFAATKRLDPRITFTRASTATYYDGTTAKAEENLLVQSQTFDNASWVKTDSSVAADNDTAPDGTTTADTMTANAANGTLLQTFTATNVAYTFSVWLKRKTGTGDVQIAADSGTWTTKTITSSWARYDVTQTPAAGSKTAGVRLVTSGDEVYVWGAQLEQRSFSTAYVATTTTIATNYIPKLATAVSGAPRFTHRPTTNESLGLLIEESRTNLLTYSEQFDNAAWTKGRATIVSNATIAPDGTLTADRIVDNTVSGTHRAFQAISKAASALTYTASCYFKAAELSYAQIRVAETGETNGAGAVINLATGQALGTYGAFTSMSAVSTSVGNGWYRLEFTFTTLTDTSLTFYVNTATGGTLGSPAYVGTGYSGVYIWGAQLEAGSFATSYIPTTSATVTRAADSASMTGTNFSSWFRQSEGTFASITQLSTPPTDKRRYVWFIDDAGSDRLCMRSTDTSISIAVYGSGTAAISLNGSAPTANQQNKCVFAYGSSGVFGQNGTLATNAAASAVSSTQTLFIGDNDASSASLSGTIARLAFYPARLTDTQVRALSV